MEPLVIGLIGIVVLVILILAGVHIGVALGMVGLVGTFFLVGIGPTTSYLATTFYYKLSTYTLLTVPLFILMGYLAGGGGVSVTLYDTLSHWFGRFKGGLGIVTVLSCAAFGTVTGSALVTSTVFGKIAGPEMRRHGYHQSLAYAIPAAAGGIGMLIPPSILMVIYGEMAGESIGRLLIAGVAPGVILALCLIGVILLMVKRKPDLISHKVLEGVTWRMRFVGLLKTWPILIVAGTIIGGIFGGIFSPTEAASVATFVLILLVIGVRRGKSWREVIWPAMKDTAPTTAMIFLIFASATVFAHFLMLAGIGYAMVNFVVGLNLSTMAFMGIMVLIYLALGCLMDSISMVAITVPLFNPVAAALGIDPIWYAMVVILAMHAGLITPPVGMCVYATKAVAEADVSIESIFKGVFPMLIGFLVAIGIMMAVPQLSTILPNLMGR